MKETSLRVALVVIAVLMALAGAGLVWGSPVNNTRGPRGPQDLTLTLYAEEDTFIWESYPSMNFGDWEQLVVGRVSGNDEDILLKFDLSALPPDAVVTDATLELSHAVNRARSIQQNYTVWVDAVTGSWQEMTVTWNNAPGSTSYGDPPTVVPGATGYISWDVTNIVQAWEGGTLTNRGFRMRGDRSTEGSAEFYSRESPFDKPRLVIAYTSGVVTPTPTPSPTNTPPHSPTPTPPGSGSCPGTVYVFADQDTYVNAEHPETEYGHLDFLWIKREATNPQDTQKNVFLHFPIDALLPPSTNIYKATLRLRVIATAGDASPYWRHGMAFNLEDPFDEDTTNWNNQPAMVFYEGSFDVSSPSGWHEVDLTELVREWYQGTEPNYGVGIIASVPLTDTYAVQYWSRNYSDASYRPRLEIECGDNVPTPTPTPTRTPTRTPTATPTITPTPVPETGNVAAWRLEVTQGVQDSEHSVPLLEGKRTYIRIAYDLQNPVPGYQYRTTAKVNIYRGGVWKASLTPINTIPGFLELVDVSWYHIPAHSFIFELPTEYTTGEIRLQGIIDPNDELPESNHADNYVNRTVSFEPAVARDLYLYLVKHIATDGTITQATLNDFPRSWGVTQAAHPWGDLTVHLRFMDWDEATMGTLDCVGANNVLINDWLADGLLGHYYALMPGWGDGTSCAADIPASMASSWADASRTTMAHELGHCFGRHHTQSPRYDDGGEQYNIGCGAKTGCWYSTFWNTVMGCPGGFEEYPYSNGSLSPNPFDVYGFYHNNEIETGADDYWTTEFYVPDYSWKDLMTYCRPERWPSDFTYLNIYNDWFKPYPQGDLGVQSTAQVTPTDCLVAAGTIYSDTGTVDMQRLYVLPDVTWAPEPTPGDFAIVLRNAADAELSRHEFTPGLVDVADFGNVLSFGELVPYVAGTVRVDIEGPTGVLTTVLSGAKPPTVTLTFPNGGQTLSRPTVIVKWMASDPDGDPLSFNLQYSADNGQTWKLLASDISGNSVWIDTDNLPGTTRGYFRVLATDGIHTAHDASDGSFVVPNHRPSVKILSPSGGDIFIVSQTVALEAQVFDVEDGTLDEGHLRWHSSLDGVVGRGAQVSVADLSAGLHTIYIVAVDSKGATDSDAVQIEVYAGPDDLPAMPDVLRAEPGMVVLDALMGTASRPIYVYNHTNPDPISWTAQASEPWVSLSASSGQTAEMVTVWANTFAMAEGHYTATVTFTNAADPEDSATVFLSVTARRFPIYLPLVLKGGS